MGERWVCKRCFSANDDSLGACANCGLARGSEVPAGDHWTAAPAAPIERRSRWRSLLGFWWVPILVIGAASAALFAAGRDETGQIDDAGDLAATEIRVGDCFDLKDPEEELIDDVEAKPCTDAHEFEMFFIGEMPDGAYPGDDQVGTYVVNTCLPAFEAYVGLSYEQSVLDIYWLTADEAGWNAGDHEVQCAVFHPTNDELTGSQRNSGR
jgi:hypothetical protein